MERKNWKVILMILIVIAVIIGAIYFAIQNINKNKEIAKIEGEYTPQEEVSDEQLRQTMINLYFISKETGMVAAENQTVDAKLLIENPYQTILSLLLEGPKNTDLVKAIPDGTKVNKVERKGDTVYLDFSSEFVENHPEGKEAEQNTINSIVQSLTELKEINKVQILINGEANQAFKDKEITFKEPFSRKEII